MHHHLVGVDGAAARDLANAQRVEGGKRVRPELDAGADLAELRGLLQHLDRKAPADQGQGGGEAPDATAGHQNLGRGAGVVHGPLLACILMMRILATG